MWCDSPEDFYKKGYNIIEDCGIVYSSCTEKGSINTMPEIAGLLVFMPSHVGVYIGNGKVIEARGHSYGVVETNLKDRGWKQWGKCKFIEFVEEDKKMFEKGQELEAIDYLVEQGRITNKEQALQKLDLIKNEGWIYIKWANDVKMLEK